jgi:hypothetical protein
LERFEQVNQTDSTAAGRPRPPQLRVAKGLAAEELLELRRLQAQLAESRTELQGAAMRLEDLSNRGKAERERQDGFIADLSARLGQATTELEQAATVRFELQTALRSIENAFNTVPLRTPLGGAPPDLATRVREELQRSELLAVENAKLVTNASQSAERIRELEVLTRRSERSISAMKMALDAERGAQELAQARYATLLSDVERLSAHAVVQERRARRSESRAAALEASLSELGSRFEQTQQDAGVERAMFVAAIGVVRQEADELAALLQQRSKTLEDERARAREFESRYNDLYERASQMAQALAENTRALTESRLALIQRTREADGQAAQRERLERQALTDARKVERAEYDAQLYKNEIFEWMAECERLQSRNAEHEATIRCLSERTIALVPVQQKESREMEAANADLRLRTESLQRDLDALSREMQRERERFAAEKIADERRLTDMADRFHEFAQAQLTRTRADIAGVSSAIDRVQGGNVWRLKIFLRGLFRRDRVSARTFEKD